MLGMIISQYLPDTYGVKPMCSITLMVSRIGGRNLNSYLS